ncbi:GNAT family N-acetyltransferase [Terribacillus sp. 179-K 1B1 HS]|uniref:GNAT family N-acetyltransferase n=1 Tax=Terribacillus sp. 179-K 1B1 HS TaxID=3142388 RepID=UPI0039A2AC56
MRFVQEHDVNRLLAKAESLLLEHEAENNLLLGLFGRLAEGEDMGAKFGYGEDDRGIRTVFLHTKGNRIILSHNTVWKDGDAVELAQLVNAWTPDLPGVIGPEKQARQFAQVWHKLYGKQIRIHMNQFIYRLDRVTDAGAAKGEMRAANKDDFTLLRDWLIRFGKSTGEDMTVERASTVIGRLIAQRRMYVWTFEDKIVSMAGCARESRNGIVINAVFTPEEQQRKGYAERLMAVLSAKLLHEGKQFCCLFTNADDPGPNKLYQKVGYRHVAKSCAIDFY